MSGHLEAFAGSPGRTPGQGGNLGSEPAWAEQARLLDLVSNPIIVWDSADRITYWNPGACQLYGYRPEEALGKNKFELLQTRFPEPREKLLVTLVGQGSWGGELVQTSKSGRQVTVLARWCLDRDAQGRVRAVLETSNDITERKQTEKALRESQAWLSTALAIAKLGIWQYDPASGLTHWDERAQEIFGVPDARGRNLEEVLSLVHPEDRQRVAGEMSRALESPLGGLFDTEYRIGRSDGSIAWLMVRGQAVLEPSGGTGQALRFTGTVLDITPSKQAEDALRESERLYRLLFDKNPDGVFSVDVEGRFQILNPACEAISGYGREELLGRHFVELCAPDQVARTLESFERLLQQPGYSELESALITKDGRRVELWVAGEPVLKAGQTVAIQCTVKDITQRKHFQSELERLVKERTAALQEATEQLNAFVYTLAHDFRAPLKAQSGFARLLLEGFGEALGSEGRHFAQRIVDAAARQGALVQDLLQQVSLSREELPLEPVDVLKVLEQVQSDLAGEIEQKQAVVQVGPLAGRVWANAAALHLVLTNLLSNALKFVPEGVRPHVRVWSEAGPDSGASATAGEGLVGAGKRVRLWVEDNGVGIRPEDQRRLFQAFQRLHAQFPGTGIGLVIVKKATERFGGHLGVESEPGKGSRFWLELRVADG